MTGGGKPRPYGFCLTSSKNVGATLAVARKGAPLGGAVCPEGRLRGVPPHFRLPTCPPTVSALRRSHLPLEGEASELCRKKRTGATGSGPLDRFILFDFQDLAVAQLLISKFVVQWVLSLFGPRQTITGVTFLPST